MKAKEYFKNHPELKPPKPVLIPTYKILEWRRMVRGMNEKIENHLKKEES